MKDLFFSELRRFRTLGLAVAVLHLLALLFMGRFTNPLQEPYFTTILFLFAYMLLGLALAVVQVGSYRKPSQWLWLMHRPLRPERIFAALGLSALALLSLAVFLPMLLWVLGTDLFTTKVVDSHHYLALVHLLAFALMAWLAGAHAVLSRHKAAIAVLAVPLLFALHLVSVWWLTLPVLASLAWLAYIAMRSFRADREAPLTSPGALLMTALPLQMGLFLLLFQVGQFLFVTVNVMLGTDPLNTDYPPAGGLIATIRAKPQDELSLGLAGSTDARAGSWREQLPLMEPIRIGPYLQRFAIRHQFTNLNAPTQWEDEQRKTFWTFSHDRMLFLGREPQSGAERGVWGLKGAGDTTPFAEVPFAGPEGYLLTRGALYAIDKEAERQHELFRLGEGEWFTDIPSRAFERLLVLTNKRLLAYRTDRQAVSPYAPPLLAWQLPLPRGPQHLEGAAIAELMDGWLVSFVYDEGHRQIGFSQFNRVVEPWQQVVHVDEEGRATVVGERAIRRDYSGFQQVGWWLSPLLHTLSEWPDSALDKGLSWPLAVEPLPKVPAFYPVAAALMLASLALALWWLRGAPVSPGRRRLWLASCAVLGLPALLSLVCLEPRAPRR